MIAEIFFLAFIFVVGWSLSYFVTIRFGTKDSILSLVLAFPIGCICWSTLGLFYLSVGYGFTLFCMLFSLLLLIGSILSFSYIKVKFQAKDFVYPILGLLAIGLVSLVINLYPITHASSDSYRIIRLGTVLAEDGYFHPQIYLALNKWGLFLSVLHGAHVFLKNDYLVALQPLLSISFFAAFGYLLFQSLKRLNIRTEEALPLSLLFTLGLSTTYLITFQAFYIHTNLPSAIYACLFCALTWLGDREKKLSYFILGSFCILAFGLLRIEATLTSIIFLVILLSLDRPSPNQKLALITLSLLPQILWDMRLATLLPAEAAGMGAAGPKFILGAAAIGALFILGSFLIKWPRLNSLFKLLPPLMLTAIVLMLFYKAITLQVHFHKNLTATIINLWLWGKWGISWLVLLCLYLIARSSKSSIKNSQIFTIPAVCLALLILFLGFFRSPYYLSWGDSANRMATHLLPMLTFYVALIFYRNPKASWPD